MSRNNLGLDKAALPGFELLQDQLGGALQMLAALVLTDGEALEIALVADPELRVENVNDWATSMKAQLLSEEGRADIVKMLRHQGFPTNSDRAFPLSRLIEAPRIDWDFKVAYDKLERLAILYANGKGENINIEDKSSWISLLVEKGVAKETAKWIMRTEGAQLTNMAQLQRSLNPNRTSPSSRAHTIEEAARELLQDPESVTARERLRSALEFT